MTNDCPAPFNVTKDSQKLIDLYFSEPRAKSPDLRVLHESLRSDFCLHYWYSSYQPTDRGSVPKLMEVWGILLAM